MSLKPVDVAKKIKELTTLPLVCMKINALLEDPHTSTHDVKRVIETDAALTSKILQVANSSFYGNIGTVDDLNRAIMLIGTQGLRDITWATSVITSFSGMTNKFVDMATFWRHSLYVGTLAHTLAGKCRIIHKDRLFLSGLLHDVGHLALYQAMPEEMEAVFEKAQNQNVPIQYAEKDVLGFTHAAVGFALLKLWRIPERVSRAVAYHHSPGKAEEYRLESAVVHLADQIANMSDIRGNKLQTALRIDPNAWSITGLSEKIIDPMVQVSEQQFNNAVSLYLGGADQTSAA